MRCSILRVILWHGLAWRSAATRQTWQVRLMATTFPAYLTCIDNCIIIADEPTLCNLMQVDLAEAAGSASGRPVVPAFDVAMALLVCGCQRFEPQLVQVWSAALSHPTSCSDRCRRWLWLCWRGESGTLIFSLCRRTQAMKVAHALCLRFQGPQGGDVAILLSSGTHPLFMIQYAASVNSFRISAMMIIL